MKPQSLTKTGFRENIRKEIEARKLKKEVLKERRRKRKNKDAIETR